MNLRNKFFLLAAALLCFTSVNAQVARPQLVVGIVVDQMRWDYLYFYNEQYREDGLKRLLNEGYSCENNMINYIPTVTAIGHASIFTGSVPALHGIAGNNFYENGKPVYCCEDKSVTPVGSNGKAGLMSPKNMYATTIGDQLRLATNFQSRVYGVALKDRAAILPAGHSANAAYWYDPEAGQFITSSYYMDKLPDWVKTFNKKNKTSGDVRGKNEGVSLTFKMAEELLANEKLGQGDCTDMLTVSISSTDIIGHATGTRGNENIGVYMQLDKDMAHFLDVLDRQVGKGNYLLFLSADHGAVHNPNYLRSHSLPGDGWRVWKAQEPLNQYLAEKFTANGKIILGSGSNRLYLDKEVIRQNNLNRCDVIAAIREYLMQDKRVAFVVDCANVANEPLPEFLRERVINGQNPKRSGDVLVITQPGVVPGSGDADYIGTSHGVWNPYDSHIPLLFYGWNIQHGSTFAPTRIVDIAPTVCALLHIQMPSACIGDPILQVVK